MRLIVMGQQAFGKDVLELLLDTGYRTVLWSQHNIYRSQQALRHGFEAFDVDVDAFLRQAATRGAPAHAIKSLANSSGIFLGAPFLHSGQRPGMALYGLNPTPGRPNPMRRRVPLCLSRAMSFHRPSHANRSPTPRPRRRQSPRGASVHRARRSGWTMKRSR